MGGNMALKYLHARSWLEEKLVSQLANGIHSEEIGDDGILWIGKYSFFFANVEKRPNDYECCLWRDLSPKPRCVASSRPGPNMGAATWRRGIFPYFHFWSKSFENIEKPGLHLRSKFQENQRKRFTIGTGGALCLTSKWKNIVLNRFEGLNFRRSVRENTARILPLLTR